MKKTIFAMLCLFFVNAGFMHAQTKKNPNPIPSKIADVIVKTDGNEIEAKVTDIGLKEIRYKKFNNSDGPVYVVPKNEIFMIKYANGDKDVFGLQENETAADETVAAERPAVQAVKAENTPAAAPDAYVPAVDDKMVMLVIVKTAKDVDDQKTDYKKGDIVWFDEIKANYYINSLKRAQVYTPEEGVTPQTINSKVLVRILRKWKSAYNKSLVYQPDEQLWLDSAKARALISKGWAKMIQTDRYGNILYIYDITEKVPEEIWNY